MSVHLEILKSKDEADFVSLFEDFANTHDIVLHSVKFQRNLYYSLSGSTVVGNEAVEDGKSLEQEYIAYIIWRDHGTIPSR